MAVGGDDGVTAFCRCGNLIIGCQARRIALVQSDEAWLFESPGKSRFDLVEEGNGVRKPVREQANGRANTQRGREAVDLGWC